MIYNHNLQKNEFETVANNMRKFTKTMNEAMSKLKDMEQTLEEEELTNIQTSVEIMKTEMEGLKRDQVLNEQNDEKLKNLVNEMKKQQQTIETQIGREMKQAQSTIKELQRGITALNITEEGLSSFVTGQEMRDQVNLGVSRVSKELEKYKAYMDPIEKKVLGTNNSNSLQNQIDEVNHQINMIQDLQKTEIGDLNRAEAELNILKAWREEMPSAHDIITRRVAKDDPVYAKIENLRKMTEDQEISINQLEGALNTKIDTNEAQHLTADDRLKRVEALVIAMGQDKSKELRMKEMEEQVNKLEGVTHKQKWTEDKINVLQDQVRQLAESTEVDLIEKLKPLQKQIKNILALQNANMASGGKYAAPTDSNQVGLTALGLSSQLRSPTPSQLVDPDGKLRRRNSTLGWDEDQNSSQRKVDRISMSDANRVGNSQTLHQSPTQSRPASKLKEELTSTKKKNKYAL